jgi:hypothetical protein
MHVLSSFWQHLFLRGRLYDFAGPAAPPPLWNGLSSFYLLGTAFLLLALGFIVAFLELLKVEL